MSNNPHDSEGSKDWLARFIDQAGGTGETVPKPPVEPPSAPAPAPHIVTADELQSIIEKSRSTSPAENVPSLAPTSTKRSQSTGQQVIIGAVVLAAAIGWKFWKDSHPPAK